MDEIALRAQREREDRKITTAWRMSLVYGIVNIVAGFMLGGGPAQRGVSGAEEGVAFATTGLGIGVLMILLAIGIRRKMAAAAALVVLVALADIAIGLALGAPGLFLVKGLMAWFAGRAFLAIVLTADSPSVLR